MYFQDVTDIRKWYCITLNFEVSNFSSFWDCVEHVFWWCSTYSISIGSLFRVQKLLQENNIYPRVDEYRCCKSTMLRLFSHGKTISFPHLRLFTSRVSWKKGNGTGILLPFLQQISSLEPNTHPAVFPAGGVNTYIELHGITQTNKMEPHFKAHFPQSLSTLLVLIGYPPEI